MPHRIICSWYTGRWWVGCCIWYSKDGSGRGRRSSRPLLAVPNVTAHPSTASVVTVLLYNSPLLCSFNVPIKGLTVMKLKHFSLTVSITIRLQARLLQRSRAMLCVTEYFAKSLIVIRNDKDVCKSLLVFHCNYVSISYCFWDSQRQIMAWPWNPG